MILIIGIITPLILVMASVYIALSLKPIFSLPLIVLFGCIYSFTIVKLDGYVKKIENEKFDNSYKSADNLNDAKLLYGNNFNGKTCYSNDIEKAFEDGAIWQKENLLNNAIDCNVDWYDGPLLDIIKEEQDELLINKLNVKFKDKLKIIILKSEEL